MLNFQNWTIRKRVICGFAAVTLLVLAQAGLSLVVLRQVNRTVDEIASDTLPGLSGVAQIQRIASDIQITLLRNLLPRSEADAQTQLELVAQLRQENDQLLADYEKTVRQEADRRLFAKTIEARDRYATVRGQVLALSSEGKLEEALALNASQLRPAFNAYQDALGDLIKFNVENGNRLGGDIRQRSTLALKLTAISAGLVLLLSIAVTALIVIGLGRVLSRVATSLSAGSEQVASAAAQASSASQSLAQGAGEQAASLEETSSSLEEMASMTRRNSESAGKASTLAREARIAADAGAADMQAMNTSMDAIKRSGDDIAKIVRTIDEIAFQTNILALNAAVEAARAGSAGAGFAVVADEVRALAQRSAQAAKETAEKIDGSITRTRQGVEISGKVAAGLTQIVAKVREVDQLINDVSTASAEQSQGVQQINGAVAQMDKVVQSTASSAEETAAASEELNAQALSMRESVDELMRLVTGVQSRPSHAPGTRTEDHAPQKGARGTARTQLKPPSRGSVTLRPANGHSLEPVSGHATDLADTADLHFRNV